jgi:hypothetical protein
MPVFAISWRAGLVHISAMTEDTPRQDIERLEAEIERLAEAAERCRKIMQASKVVIVLGIALLGAILLGFIRADAMPLFSSFAVIIGGIVVFGTNSSTARQMAERIADAEAERAVLIGGIDLRLIPEGTPPAAVMGRVDDNLRRSRTLH